MAKARRRSWDATRRCWLPADVVWMPLSLSSIALPISSSYFLDEWFRSRRRRLSETAQKGKPIIWFTSDQLVVTVHWGPVGNQPIPPHWLRNLFQSTGAENWMDLPLNGLPPVDFFLFSTRNCTHTHTHKVLIDIQNWTKHKTFSFLCLVCLFLFFFLFFFLRASCLRVFFFFACVCCLLPQWIHRRTHSHVSFLIFRGCFFYFFFFHLFWFVSFPWLPLCSLYDFARPARRVVYKTVIDLDELYTQTHAHDRWWASRNHLVRWGGGKLVLYFVGRASEAAEGNLIISGRGRRKIYSFLLFIDNICVSIAVGV